MHKKSKPVRQPIPVQYVETVTLVPDVEYLDTLAKKSQNGVPLSPSDFERLRKIASHYVDRHASDKSLDMVDKVYQAALSKLAHGRTVVGATMWMTARGGQRV